MAIVLDLRRPKDVVRPAGGIAYGAVTPDRTVSRAAYSDRLVRFIAFAPLLASSLIAFVQVTNVTGSPGRVATVVALACCMMAANLHHLWALAHAERPRAAGWTLALVFVAYATGLPLGGLSWPLMGVHLLVSAVIVLRRPWSVVAGCGVGIAMLVVAQVFYPGTNPLWTTVVILDRSGACLALAWLSAALRQLLAAREELAVQAVLRERIRIDAELAETVGTALGTIAGRGAAISRLAGQDSALAAEQLRALVDGSRQTLAETRRMIRTYQRGSLGAELDTAVALLGAAGIQARLMLPDGGLIEGADDAFAAELRAVVDRLLHDGSVRSCRLRVVHSAGGLQLLVDADGSGQVESA
jgi:two-component system sensor histidine kinase DesK